MNINHKISKSWQRQKTAAPNQRNLITIPLQAEPDPLIVLRKGKKFPNFGTPGLLYNMSDMGAINQGALEANRILGTMCNALGIPLGAEMSIAQMIESIQKKVPVASIATVRKIKYPKGLTPQISEMEGNGMRNRVLGNILGDGLSESEFDSLIQHLRESHTIAEIESSISTEKSHIRILGQTEGQGPFKEVYEILTFNIS